MVRRHDVGMSGRNDHVGSRRSSPRIAFWHDSRSSRRNNTGIRCVETQARCSGTVPDVQTVVFQRDTAPNENEPLQGTMKREFEV
eukprot:3060750-Pyramimonas_sp.AAC.1